MGSEVDLDDCGKISPPTDVRSPDRPARSESLYRLSYPGTQNTQLVFLFVFPTAVEFVCKSYFQTLAFLKSVFAVVLCSTRIFAF